MSDSIWTGTLASFRDRIAGTDPVPAGVSAAAASAVFAFGLLTKVLDIVAKRKDFAGDRDQLRAWISAAHRAAETLAQLADDDIAAFHEYLDCRRGKEPLEAVTRKTIQVPLAVARTAASGLQLCERAAAIAHAFVAPDVAAAAALLNGAVSAALCSVESNLRQLSESDPYRIEASAEAHRLAGNKKAG
jgi:methenyltetrahydrofolate cyclohydrolase